MLKEYNSRPAPPAQEVVVPIYSPRTTYNNIRSNDETLLVDLTLNFDPFTINILKNEFKVHKGAMEIVDFVLILKEHLLTWQKDIPFREKRLIRVLVMLFEEIDLNGNRLLEWDEFTNYIIEKATVLNSMKRKEEEIKTYATVPFRINKKFQNLLTKVIYIPDLDRLATFEEGSDDILFINHETGSYNPKPLKVAPPKEVRLEHQYKELAEDSDGDPIVRAERSMVLDMIYVQDSKTKFYYLITSSNDGALRIWKFNGNSFANVNPDGNEAVYTGEAQTCLAWDYATQTLYSGQRKGVINAWSLNTLLGIKAKTASDADALGTNPDATEDQKNEAEAKDKNDKSAKSKAKLKKPSHIKTPSKLKQRSKSPQKGGDEKNDDKTKDKNDKNDKSDKNDKNDPKKKAKSKESREKLLEPAAKFENGHTDVIMDIVIMQKLQMFATCSLDKTIILWHGVEKKKLRTYREHSKGVVSLTFNESLILLVSAGYDHQICIWNPYIDNPIFKISSHNFPLICVKLVEGTSHFVSLDTAGTIKVWDFKKFNCIQTFMVESEEEKHKFRPQGFTYIPKPLKLALAGRSLFLFEYDKNYNPTSVDDLAVLNVCYRSLDNSIITPAGNKVKVWNALTGGIKKIFADMTTAEITAFSLDHLKKRCLVGFSNGEAAVFNVINGAKVKTLPKHQGEVNFIFEAPNLTLIITASSVDATIRMSTDTDINETEQKRMIPFPDQIISAITYKAKEKVLVVGTRGGVVSFWETETGKLMGQTNFPNEEITTISALSELEYVLVGTSSGRISMIASPPLPYRFTEIFKFINYDEESPSAPAYIQEMIWSEEKRILFIGDEKCYIKRLDFSKHIDQIIESKKAQNSKDARAERSHLTGPTITQDPPRLVWATKAHTEALKAIEYVDEEDILFSAGLDKKVKVWSAANGQYIDALQQKYDKIDPAVIAYKKSGTTGIIGPDMKTRVDREYTSLSEWEKDEMAKAAKAAEKERLRLLEEESQFVFQYRASRAGASRENSIRSGISKERAKGSLSDSGKKQYGSFGGASAAPLNNTSNGAKDNSPTKRNIDYNRLVVEHWMINNNMNLDRAKAYDELEKEVFDPFYNWSKIDTESMGNPRSSEWKLHVKFEKNRDEFDNYIKEITQQIEAIEEDQVEIDGDNGQQFKMTGFEVEEPAYNKPRNQTSAEGQRDTENKVDGDVKNDDFGRKSLPTPKSPDGKVQKSILKKTTDWESKSMKKEHHNLHRIELKGKVLDKNRPMVALSQEEVSAAYRLAAALSNYDKDDTRNLKFSEIKVKQIAKKNTNEKDFIGFNMKNLTEFTSSSSLKKSISPMKKA